MRPQTPGMDMGSAASQTYEGTRRGRTRRIPKWLWVVLGIGVAIGVYALLGFLLLPRVLRAQATEYVREEYGRELELGDIYVHPFAFTLDVRNVQLPDADGSPMLGFRSLFIDFEAASSLFHWTAVFREVTLQRPGVVAVVRRDGSFNLADLAPSEDPDEEEDDDEGVPSVLIQTLSVYGGDLQYFSRDRPKVFHQRVSPVSFTLENFDTTGDEGRMHLSAKLPGGAQLGWKGTIGVHEALKSSGEITVSRFPIRKVAAFLGDTLPFKVPRGTAGLAGRYSVRADETLNASLELDHVTLRRSAVRERGSQEDAVKLPEIKLTKVQVRMPAQRVSVDTIAVVSPHVVGALESDGTLSLSRLAQSPPSAPKPPTRRAGPSADTQEAAPWALEIAHFRLKKGRVDLEDHAFGGGATWTFSPIEVAVDKASLDLTRSLPVRFSTTINGDGLVRVRGNVRPAPLEVALEVHVEDLPLRHAQPYVKPFANLTLRSGSLESDGRLSLGDAKTTGAEVVYDGGFQIKKLATTGARRTDLLGFDAMAVRGIHYTASPDALHIKRVDLRKPSARVVLRPDQKLNVVEVFDVEEAKTPEAKTSGARDQATPSSSPMPIEIDLIRVRKMALDYTDYLVEPNFSAQIRSLSGGIRGLSSKPRSRAKIRLKGWLGDNSPVTIHGRVQPFAYDKFTDIHLELENVALPIFNPYSGPVAGYNIERGELSTALHYEVRNRKLEASHNVRIDQLAWGDKTKSKERAPLPVRLATALLRDRHGVITLDLPVSGTLDDPSFRLRPVIWKAVKNVIVKAASAPFDLLGRAFKGADDARYVDFAPGSDQLDTTQRQALSALAKAMKQRPSLKLEVPVGTVDDLDTQALRERKFEHMLSRAAEETLSRRAKRSGVTELDQLSAEQRLDALTELHEQLTGDDPELVEPPEPPDHLTRSQAKEAQYAHQADALAKQTLARVAVEPDRLTALGRRRAEAIEAEVVRAGGLDASHVLLSTKGKVKDKKGKIRFHLDLK